MGKSLGGKGLGKGITQRKDGRYQISFTTIYGKRRTLYAKTEKEAKEVLRGAKDPENCAFTLNEFYDVWKDKIRVGLRDTTRRTYDTYFGRVRDGIGRMPLKDITRHDIQGALNKMASDGMRKDTKELLSSVLKDAALEGLIAKNPSIGCRWRLDDEAPKDKQILSREDEEKLEHVIYKDGSFYILYTLALETGMRIGELTGLCRSDVDLNRNVIHVRHSIAYVPPAKYELKGPKTKAGYRDIPLSARARDVIVKAFDRKGRIEEKYEAKETLKDILIVSSRNRPIDEANVKSQMQTYCKRAGVPYVTPHGLRHTFATRCIARGMKPKVLQKLLGHASLSLTMDLYCHVEDETLRSEMALVFKMA